MGRHAAQQQQQPSSSPPPPLAGEDAAVFDLSQQSLRSWGLFAVLLTGVSALLYAVWIAPGGLGLGDVFVAALSALAYLEPCAHGLDELIVFDPLRRKFGIAPQVEGRIRRVGGGGDDESQLQQQEQRREE